MPELQAINWHEVLLAALFILSEIIGMSKYKPNSVTQALVTIIKAISK